MKYICLELTWLKVSHQSHISGYWTHCSEWVGDQSCWSCWNALRNCRCCNFEMAGVQSCRSVLRSCRCWICCSCSTGRASCTTGAAGSCICSWAWTWVNKLLEYEKYDFFSKYYQHVSEVDVDGLMRWTHPPPLSSLLSPSTMAGRR